MPVFPVLEIPVFTAEKSTAADTHSLLPVLEYYRRSSSCDNFEPQLWQTSIFFYMTISCIEGNLQPCISIDSVAVHQFACFHLHPLERLYVAESKPGFKMFIEQQTTWKIAH
jgi:hypothetical protein